MITYLNGLLSHVDTNAIVGGIMTALVTLVLCYCIYRDAEQSEKEGDA